LGTQHHQQRTSNDDGQLLKSAFPSRTPTSLAEKTYRGLRNPDGPCDVWSENPATPQVASGRKVSSSQLSLHLELGNHSPTGFAWGYGGSGPAQLALALLMDATGDCTLALRHYQDFKFQFVAGWGDSWSITSEEIKSFLVARESLAGCQCVFSSSCPDC
jgi:hypothetical protein